MQSNAHDVLEDLRLTFARELVRLFSADQIRRHALANLDRWKSIGTDGFAYDEWRTILTSVDDDTLCAILVADTDEGRRRRQSMPCTGLLPRDIVESLNRQAGAELDRLASLN